MGLTVVFGWRRSGGWRFKSAPAKTTIAPALGLLTLAMMERGLRVELVKVTDMESSSIRWHGLGLSDIMNAMPVFGLVRLAISIASQCGARCRLHFASGCVADGDSTTYSRKMFKACV